MPNIGSPISLSQADVELGFGSTTTISMNDTSLRALFGIASGAISMYDGYGKSNITPAGYFGGGNSTYSNSTSTAEIDGIIFSNEAATNPTAALVVARAGMAGVSSLTRGYFLGGLASGTFSAEIDGLQFSSVTAINPAATLPAVVWEPLSVFSTTKGYSGGGYNSSYVALSSIVGFVFSSETASTLSAVLVLARATGVGLSGSTSGYFCGGSGFSSEIDGINFSTDTAINPAATIANSNNTLYAGSLSGSAKGYIGGGGGTGSNSISGFVFATETATTQSAVLATVRRLLSGVASTSKGYFAGGLLSDSITTSSEIDGIVFSGETAINPASALATARELLSGVQVK